MLSRKAILLLKGYFGREKIIFHEKSLKQKKIILLKKFIFAPIFFLIASYQILKHYAILIHYESLFQGKDSLQLNCFQFLKMNKLLSNSAIFLIKISFWKFFFMVLSIKEFIFKNWKRWSCRESFVWKIDSWFIRIA